MRSKILRFLEHQPKAALWAEALVLLSICGAIDALTGYEVSIVPFYALPILLLVWFDSQKSGVFMSLLCAIVWWWADAKAGHPYIQDWHQGWDAGVRLSIFLVVVVAGSSLKERIGLLKQSNALEQEIIRISEREQRRIGYDLHDGLCQYFAAIGCAVGSLKQKLARDRAEEAAAAAEIEDLIMRGVEDARNLARGLSPVADDEDGLRSALEEFAAHSKKLMNLDCRFECDLSVTIPNHLHATHLFRIAQEAVNNANRHGHATAVTIRLESEPDEVKLSVLDNGAGFGPTSTENRGMGLKIMQYRARSAGGQLSISPNDGGGVVVCCSLPTVSGNPCSTDDERIR